MISTDRPTGAVCYFVNKISQNGGKLQKKLLQKWLWHAIIACVSDRAAYWDVAKR